MSLSLRESNKDESVDDLALVCKTKPIDLAVLDDYLILRLYF